MFHVALCPTTANSSASAAQPAIAGAGRGGGGDNGGNGASRVILRPDNSTAGASTGKRRGRGGSPGEGGYTLRVGVGRSILHVDMDAFFAAIEQLDRPDLRGRPVLVGHDGPRGVISTASYEARPFGCRSAMPTAMARRLCPEAVVVPPRFERYHAVSSALHGILESFTPLIEPLSLDEAFLDVSGSLRLFGPPAQIARRLRERIRAELRLTASVGVSHNKFLAKLASDMDKPDGLTVIEPGDVERVLAPLPVGRIWGVGPRTAESLAAIGVRTIADLRRADARALQLRVGGDAARLQALALGQDERPVEPDHEAKSISQEQTFADDIADVELLRGVLLDQVEQVAWRLRRARLHAAGVSLKLRDGQFRTITRASRLDFATDQTESLWRAGAALLEAWAGTRPAPLRLLGFAAAVGRDAGQMPLFDAETRRRQARLDEAVDRINERFGRRTVHRGRLDGQRQPPPDAD